MTPRELEQLVRELEAGKLLLMSDVDFGYGDRQQTFVRHDPSRGSLVWEVYNLHGNGEELSRQELIEPDRLPRHVAGTFEELCRRLVDPAHYPYVR